MSRATRHSYALTFATLVLVGWFGLATPFITVFFSYFALSKLNFMKRKWLTIVAFLALVAAVCFGLAYFLHHVIHTLPSVVTTSIPKAIEYAESHGLALPFSDWNSLKEFALDSVKGALPYLGNAARAASKQFVFLILGVVVAISLFLNPKIDLREGDSRHDLYSVLAQEIAARFAVFYQCFATVMGAQMVISTINTGLTAIFIRIIGLPHWGLVVVTTFLCGFLPIVGNLISNSIIVGIALLVSPQLALWALAFLVGLHKLEYFLNSKIIGERIKSPVWLTLIGLIVGERLMGVAGMILAPVVLNYLKVEGSRIKAVPTAEERNREWTPMDANPE